MCTFFLSSPYLTIDDPPASPAEQYQALLNAVNQAEHDFNQAYNAAKTDQERQKVAKDLGRKASASSFAPKFLTLIQNYPQDKAALDAFWWLISRVRGAQETDDAVDVLLRYRMQDADLARTCQSLTYYHCRAGDRLLRAAIERSPHHAVQGYARFSLALSLRHDASRANVERRDALENEAKQLLQEVAKSYSDLKYRATTLGKAAEGEFFELTRLGIGKEIPEIEGKDLQGGEMKLSDYRGKVVLLVYWATWCGPCMSDIPREVELFKQYHDQPFAIVGVNADEDRLAALQACQKHSIPWRSFYDGKRDRPISTRWNVNSWPTLFLIDQKGIIRYKTDDLRSIYIREKNGKHVQVWSLDEALELMMKTVEAENKPK
jgi:thiol-disulfide isomerase/thioredoxin